MLPLHKIEMSTFSVDIETCLEPPSQIPSEAYSEYKVDTEDICVYVYMYVSSSCTIYSYAYICNICIYACV